MQTTALWFSIECRKWHGDLCQILDMNHFYAPKYVTGCSSFLFLQRKRFDRQKYVLCFMSNVASNISRSYSNPMPISPEYTKLFLVNLKNEAVLRVWHLRLINCRGGFFSDGSGFEVEKITSCSMNNRAIYQD